MSNTQTGNCQKCGAPIYSPSVWMGVIPPPPIYTCTCHGQTAKVITTTGTAVGS